MLRFLLNLRVKFVLLLIFLGLCILVFKNVVLDKDGKEGLPVIVWWTPFMPEGDRILECGGNFRCLSTRNRSVTNEASAFLFYGSNFDPTDLPLPKNKSKPWAIFHEESPKNLALFLDERGQNLFDITSTFSRESDMPVTLQYLKNIKPLTDTTYYVPVEEKNKLLKGENEIAPVLYLQSSCDTPLDRDGVVSKLMEYIPIDSYGECLNNKKLPEELVRTNSFDVYDDKALRFESKYKFIISIENAVCDDYITEKFWRPLMLGDIPIYLGSPTIHHWLPNKKSAILINEYKSIEEIANVIHYINDNDNLYNEYVQHKISGRISNEYLKSTLALGNFGVEDCQDDEFAIESFECHVCKAVSGFNTKAYKENPHKPNGPKQKPYKHDRDEAVKKPVLYCPLSYVSYSWRTHWKMGRCQAKTLDHFVNGLMVKNFTKKEYEELYLKYFTEGKC